METDQTWKFAEEMTETAIDAHGDAHTLRPVTLMHIHSLHKHTGIGQQHFSSSFAVNFHRSHQLPQAQNRHCDVLKCIHITYHLLMCLSFAVSARMNPKIPLEGHIYTLLMGMYAPPESRKSSSRTSLQIVNGHMITLFHMLNMHESKGDTDAAPTHAQDLITVRA